VEEESTQIVVDGSIADERFGQATGGVPSEPANCSGHCLFGGSEPDGVTTMDLREEFRRHADECRQTARLTKHPVDRAQWESLAERWDRCVETAESAFAAVANARNERTRQMRRFGRGSE
jgi:hypothetical protein